MKLFQYIISQSWKIGRVMGINLEIHITWFVVLILITFNLAHSIYQGIPVAFLLSFVSVILLFASITIHELAHSYFALRYGIGVQRILWFMFGGVAQINHEPKTPRAEFIIAIAGPACSFLIALIFFGGGLFLFPQMTTPETKFSQILMGVLDGTLIATYNPWKASIIILLVYMMFLNFVLATINLIPIFPLDGGRILRAVLWRILRNFKRATIISARIGQFSGGSLIVWGIIDTFRGYYLDGIWVILIGLFLFRAAQNTERHVRGFLPPPFLFSFFLKLKHRLDGD